MIFSPYYYIIGVGGKVMKLIFRWYGEKDCIPLNYIKRIQGITGVFTAVYDEPVGNVWSVEKLEKLKNLAVAAYTITR